MNNFCSTGTEEVIAIVHQHIEDPGLEHSISIYISILFVCKAVLYFELKKNTFPTLCEVRKFPPTGLPCTFVSKLERNVEKVLDLEKELDLGAFC